jgi:hypothetical protein
MQAVPADWPAAPVDFRQRADLPEIMDDAGLDPATYAGVFADLAGVNTIPRARPPTLAWLKRHAAGMRRFTLVDVGFGHGDMLRAIAGWARRAGIEAELIGVDLNPRSAPVAQAVTDPSLGITYVTGRAEALELGVVYRAVRQLGGVDGRPRLNVRILNVREGVLVGVNRLVGECLSAGRPDQDAGCVPGRQLDHPVRGVGGRVVGPHRDLLPVATEDQVDELFQTTE